MTFSECRESIETIFGDSGAGVGIKVMLVVGFRCQIFLPLFSRKFWHMMMGALAHG